MRPAALLFLIPLCAPLVGCGSAASGLKEARTQFDGGHYGEARTTADGVVGDYADAKEAPAARFVAAASTAAIAIGALDAGDWDKAAREFREYDGRVSDALKLSGAELPIGKMGLYETLSPAIADEGEPAGSIQVRIDGACENEQCRFALALPAPKSRGDMLVLRAGFDLPDDATVEPGITFPGAVKLIGMTKPGPASRAWLVGKACASAGAWSGWSACERPKLEGLSFSDAEALVTERCAITGILATECSGAVADRAKVSEVERTSAWIRLDSMRGTELCANVERIATALSPDTFLLVAKGQPKVPPTKWWDLLSQQDEPMQTLMVLAGMNVASKKASADLLPLNAALEGMGDAELVTGLKGSVRLLLLSFAVLGRDTAVTLGSGEELMKAATAGREWIPQAYDAAGPLVAELRSTCAEWKIPG